MTSVINWLRRERSSTRLAFLLQVFSRLATSVMALLWTRLLLDAMGESLNGLWLSFQAVALLGGLGDLGMGGAVGMRVSRYLGQKDENVLKRFLATARALFIALGFLVSLIFLVASPWISTVLGFESLPNAGSMTLLFAFASVGFALLILSSYIANVGYACGNITWPIIPTFLLTQASLATHWWLAQKHAPLWMQYWPYLVCSAFVVLLTWWFLRISDPSAARIFPLEFHWREWRSLTGDSFWLYFWSLGSVVYIATDRLVLQKGFGPDIVPTYYYNYKVSELLLSLIVAATFSAMPKIARWLASSNQNERTHGIQEILRLHRVEVVLTCGCALGYLALNDDFVRLWLGRKIHGPIQWQFAFALSLVITGCADAAVQTAPRCSQRGLRISGIAVAMTALINVVLSIVAMKRGSILGIAFATVVAQSFFSLWLSRFVCRQLNLSWARWIWRGWLAPVIIIASAFAARVLLPFDSVQNVLLLAGVYLLLFLAAMAAAGITPDLLRHEWAMIRSVFRSTK